MRNRVSFSVAALAVLLVSTAARAQGVGTRFDVWAPANNDNVGRDVYVVVTNPNGGPVLVNVVDTNDDGDDDDSVTNQTLAAGRSIVVRIRDKGVNDDAGGKWDGDRFLVTADGPVSVWTGTASSWEHDWVPANDTRLTGNDFVFYNNKPSVGNNDVDVFAFEEDTTVVVEKISTQAKLDSGLTTVNPAAPEELIRVTLRAGEDLMARHGLGIDLLQQGHTYRVRATKPVSVQWGALDRVEGGDNARDGGGWVPSRVAAAGDKETFLFTIPCNRGNEREKELRVVAADAATVRLYGFDRQTAGWILIDTRSMPALAHQDWIGTASDARTAQFRAAPLYKIEAEPPGRVRVYETNWLETAGTSASTNDETDMVPGLDGRGISTDFIAWVGPPAKQDRVVGIEGVFSHLVLLTGNEAATVTITTSIKTGPSSTARSMWARSRGTTSKSIGRCTNRCSTRPRGVGRTFASAPRSPSPWRCRTSTTIGRRSFIR